MTRNISPGPVKHGRRTALDAAGQRSNYVSQCKNCGFGVFSNLDDWTWQTSPLPGIIHARCASR